MAILGSPLLPLGLLLCLWLLCSPASCTNHTAKCTLFSSVINKNSSQIHVNPEVYESNTLYTVSIHIDDNITSVVLEARDQHNSVIGSWQNPSQYCEGSAVYDLKDQFSMLFEAKWMSPNSMNITAVKINVYTVNFLRNAEHSSITLSGTGALSAAVIKYFPTKNIIKAPTHKPTTTHHKPTTTHHETTTTHHETTTTHHIPNTTLPKLTTTHRAPLTFRPKLTTTHNRHTTKSSGNRAFLSPVKEAVQILLIFLTSTLLF